MGSSNDKPIVPNEVVVEPVKPTPIIPEVLNDELKIKIIFKRFKNKSLSLAYRMVQKKIQEYLLG